MAVAGDDRDQGPDPPVRLQNVALVDEAYLDPRLAALYDALNPWGPSDDF